MDSQELLPPEHLVPQRCSNRCSGGHATRASFAAGLPQGDSMDHMFIQIHMNLLCGILRIIYTVSLIVSTCALHFLTEFALYNLQEFKMNVKYVFFFVIRWMSMNLNPSAPMILSREACSAWSTRQRMCTWFYTVHVKEYVLSSVEYMPKNMHSVLYRVCMP